MHVVLQAMHALSNFLRHSRNLPLKWPGCTRRPGSPPDHRDDQVAALHAKRIDGGFLFHRDTADPALTGIVVLEETSDAIA